MKTQNGRIRFEVREDLPPTAMSLAGTEWNLTGSWKFLEPGYLDMTPPCSNVCLTRMDVVAMMRAVEEGRLDDAVKGVLEVNPFPSITGRLCPHPCEQPCNRKAYGGGISVRAVERLVGDHKLATGIRPDLLPPVRARVHVVGSGPAGLSAAVYLRALGHPVTIHEEADEAGGILRYGVPGYRLPLDILRAEVCWVEGLGVEIETGKRLSRKALADLGPTILCSGYARSRPLGIPGEDGAGVLDGRALLAAVRRGVEVRAGRRAAVVGDGWAAMDVARTLVRCGTSAVVCCPRSAREATASRDDVDAAKAEGVEILFDARPARIEVEGSGLRLVLEPAKGLAASLDVDAVVNAGGTDLDGDALPPGVRAEADHVATDEAGWTGSGDVFASGEAAGRLGHTASEAILSGRLAAHAVHERVTGRVAPPAWPTRDAGADPEVAKFKGMNLAYFEKEAPRTPAVLAPQERRASFSEVEAGLSSEDARAEAARCFKCGTCVECDNCFLYCPDVAIHKKPGGGYSIDLAHCKGCGVCVEECPRQAIHLRKST